MRPHSTVRTLAAAVALLGGSLAAQITCYEPQFGTLLGTGDDTLFAIQPVGFAFPFGGVTYTDLHISTNGLFFLSNAGTPAPGTATGGSYSPTGTTLVTGSPKIAPNWHDLNVVAPGGVYLNNTIPGKCVITWDQATDYGNAVVYTFQCQLYASGEIEFYYSSPTLVRNANAVVVGFSPAGGVTAPAASNLSAPVSTTVPTVFESFNSSSLPFDLASKGVVFVPNAVSGYDSFLMQCGPSNETYGAGCTLVARSFYESFGGTAFDLGVAAPAVNSRMLLPNANGGYTVTAGSTGWFTHTVTGLGLTDDSVGTLALPAPFNFPGGSTTALTICSNGFITLNGTSTNTAWSPSTSALLTGEPRLCPAWTDMLPDGITNVNNVFAEVDAVANVAYVTWNAVPTYSVGGAMTMQVALDLNTGIVEFRYMDCLAPGSSLCGFSAGVAAVDPGNRDLHTLPFSTAYPESLPLTLAASAAPALGTTVTYTTGNVPASAIFGVQLISFGAVVPGFDLGVVGAPGCLQSIDLNVASMLVISGTPNATLNVTMPSAASWTGAVVYHQSAMLVPGINALGVVTSNAIKSTLF